MWGEILKCSAEISNIYNSKCYAMKKIIRTECRLKIVFVRAFQFSVGFWYSNFRMTNSDSNYGKKIKKKVGIWKSYYSKKWKTTQSKSWWKSKSVSSKRRSHTQTHCSLPFPIQQQQYGAVCLYQYRICRSMLYWILQTSMRFRLIPWIHQCGNAAICWRLCKIVIVKLSHQC